MSDMNNISVTGNLGRDAEIKHLPSGESVTEFTVAVSGFKKDAPPMWLRCSLFGKRGESVAKYLTKGSRIGVTGQLQVREWDAKDGAKKTSVEIRANDVTLLGSKSDGQRSGGGQRSEPFPESDPVGGTDDEIPFGPHDLP